MNSVGQDASPMQRRLFSGDLKTHADLEPEIEIMHAQSAQRDIHDGTVCHERGNQDAHSF
jgi:hypothetical protein